MYGLGFDIGRVCHGGQWAWSLPLEGRVSLFIPNQGTSVVSCGRIVVYTLKS